jgi:ABC-2 type transport system permease protein
VPLSDGMTRHFVWFAAVTARNRVRMLLRRLRSPRYAIAATVGFLYFVLIFGDWAAQPAAGEPAVGEIYIEAARRAGPLAIGAMAAWWWLWGGHRFGLALTPAETHLLVPAPLTRAALVRFRILLAQVPILFSASLATLLTRGAPLPWPLRLMSLWVLLATLQQHQIAASLVHAAAEQQGHRGMRRVWFPALLFTAALVSITAALWRAVAQIRAAGITLAGSRVIALMDEPAVRLPLTPFRLLLDPLVATSAAEWAPAFAAAGVVLLAHYVWLQRTDAAFEEAAAAAGAVRASRAAAVQAGGYSRLAFSGFRGKRVSQPLLRLHPFGAPGYAIFWKNITYVQRLVRPLTVVLLLVFVIIVTAPGIMGAPTTMHAVRAAGFVALIVAGVVTIGGPFAVRNDLRLDLAYFESLRTLPLSGHAVVAGGVAACAAVVTLLQWSFALAGMLLLASAGTLTPGQTLAGSVAALTLLPLLALLGVIVQNAVALFFPGWTHVGRHDGSGMESIGQNVVTLIGSLLLLLIALVPALVVGAAGGALLLGISHYAAATVAALSGGAVLMGECLLLMRWLGGLFDRTDPVTAGLLN